MMQVVGFEGGSPGEPATFGTAAFRNGDQLINPVTGSVSDFSRWEEIVEDGHAVPVGPFDLPGSKSYLLEKPCILLRTGFNDPGVVRGLTAMASHVWKEGQDSYLLFSSMESLARAARPAVQNLLRSRDPACLRAARILRLSYDRTHSRA